MRSISLTIRPDRPQRYTLYLKAYTPIQLNAQLTGLDLTGLAGTLILKQRLSDTTPFAQAAMLLGSDAGEGYCSFQLTAAMLATANPLNLHADIRIEGYGNPLPPLSIKIIPSANQGDEDTYAAPELWHWLVSGTEIEGEVHALNFQGATYTLTDGVLTIIGAGGGASDVSQLLTTTGNALEYLRVKAGGGLEYRTPTQARSDINAETAGAAATVQGNLTTHTGNTSNPHSVTKTQLGLGNVDNTSDANKPVSTATATALGGKADLIAGKVPTSQIPAVAIREFLGSVANQAAMLLLVGQEGDWCVRTDTGTNFELIGDDPTDINDWLQLSYPASPVTSVNGQTGTVVLGAADVGASATSHTHSDATTSVAGFMAAADKTKLDGIEALADVTDAGNVGAAIDGADAVTTLGDTDKVPVTQSGTLVTIAYSALKTLLNAIYAPKITTQTLTDVATVVWNVANLNAKVTIAGNRAMETTGTPVEGQLYTFRVTLSGAGRTLTWSGTYFELPAGTAPPLASGNGQSTDMIFKGLANGKLALQTITYAMA